jgi:hypothetical protein
MQKKSAGNQEPAKRPLPRGVDGMGAKDKLTEQLMAGNFPDGSREFLNHVHSYVADHIRLADEKAGFTVTVSSAMLAFLHTQKLLPSLVFEMSFVGFLRFLSVSGLGLAISSAAWVVLPRTTGDPKGIVFWKAIAAMNSSQLYENIIKEMSPEGLSSELARHVYELSSICREKYKRLSFAMHAGSVGLLASVGLILFK